MPVHRLVVLEDEAGQRGVICKLDETSRVVLAATVCGVQGEQSRRQHAALGGRQCWWSQDRREYAPLGLAVFAESEN